MAHSKSRVRVGWCGSAPWLGQTSAPTGAYWCLFRSGQKSEGNKMASIWTLLDFSIFHFWQNLHFEPLKWLVNFDFHRTVSWADFSRVVNPLVSLLFLIRSHKQICVRWDHVMNPGRTPVFRALIWPVLAGMMTWVINWSSGDTLLGFFGVVFQSVCKFKINTSEAIFCAQHTLRFLRWLLLHAIEWRDVTPSYAHIAKP